MDYDLKMSKNLYCNFRNMYDMMLKEQSSKWHILS